MTQVKTDVEHLPLTEAQDAARVFIPGDDQIISEGLERILKGCPHRNLLSVNTSEGECQIPGYGKIRYMVRLALTEKDSMEYAVNRFNKLVQASGNLKAFQKKKFYEKPSVLRRRKQLAKLRKSRQRTTANQHLS